MNASFRFLESTEFTAYLPLLHDMLYDNMLSVTHAKHSREESFSQWYKNVYPALLKPARKIILMFIENKLAGYFQYYINNDVLMMEEIQIKREYHESGLFGLFFTHLVNLLPESLSVVRAYSEKQNLKSQGILKRLMLVNIPERDDGDFLFFEGSYRVIYEKYRK